MPNYDDEINDLLDRVESLEDGGGGGATPSASNVTYDDSATSFGASTVQIALEKIKALIDGITSRFSDFLPVTGGTVTGDLTVNGVIDGTTTGNALPIVVENVEVTGSVNGSSTATIAGDVSKEGYTTLGILGYEIAGSSQCYCYRVYTVGNSARFYTRNNGSGTVNLTITAHILYQVDNGSPRIIEPPITNEGV